MQPIVNILSFFLSLFGLIKPEKEDISHVARSKAANKRTLFYMSVTEHICWDSMRVQRFYKQWWIPDYDCIHAHIKTRMRRNTIDDIVIVRVMARVLFHYQSFYSGVWCLLPEPIRFEIALGYHNSIVDSRFLHAHAMTDKYLAGIISETEYAVVDEKPSVKLNYDHQ